MGLWPCDSVSYRQQPSTVGLSVRLRVCQNQDTLKGMGFTASRAKLPQT